MHFIITKTMSCRYARHYMLDYFSWFLIFEHRKARCSLMLPVAVLNQANHFQAYQSCINCLICNAVRGSYTHLWHKVQVWLAKVLIYSRSVQIHLCSLVSGAPAMPHRLRSWHTAVYMHTCNNQLRLHPLPLNMDTLDKNTKVVFLILGTR